MAQCVLNGVKMTGCSLVLGENKCRIEDYPLLYNGSNAQLLRLKESVGLGTRYVANQSTTTADLCEQAARMLMEAHHISPSHIGAIISITQTPDYRMPGNAHVLHARLGLSQHALALDAVMGCSGFVYGVWLAGMMIASGISNVLLLAGDTLSREINPEDKVLAPLFGDAGSATLLEATPNAQPMHFILRADGTRLKSIYIPAGGARCPSTKQTQQLYTAEDGSTRSQDNLFMDGFDVFRFSMAEQPPLLQDILAFSGKKAEDIDYFLLHQANKLFVDSVAKKTGIPSEKMPSDIFSRYGNLNAASIPAVLCHSLGDTIKENKLQAVLQGFGVGLSWGACQLELDNVLCLPPVRYGQR